MTFTEIEEIRKRVQPFTMTERETVRDLIRRVEYVTGAGVPGAFVECGVWKGGSMMAMALTLMALGRDDRDLWLFDTFSGMTAPEAVDVDVRGTQDCSGVGAPGLEEVKDNMKSTGYPSGMTHYVMGEVEKTLPELPPLPIALLRLDTDWYASTRCELGHLYPWLMPGGVLIVDDYGYWKGSQKATDEFLGQHGGELALERLGPVLVGVRHG